MNILTVTPHKFMGDTMRQNLLPQHDVSVHTISPTLLSAFTAMSIASECASKHIRLVHTFRPQDAMAAISARKISKDNDFKIVLEFPANAPKPRALTDDIINGIDAWVFPTDRLAQLAVPSGKPSLVISTRDALEAPQPLRQANDSQHHLLWVGPLEKNIDNLKRAIMTIGDSNGAMRLTVLGTGSARYAMQAVKLSRALPMPELVKWQGNNYNIDEILPTATAIVQSQADPMPVELDLAANLCLCAPTSEGFVIQYPHTPNASQRAELLTDFFHRL